MTDVLFVCAGNVSRSQVAEAYFRKYAKHHTASSAGARYSGHPRISPTMKRILKMEGIDTEEQMPKELTPDMVESADRVVALCSRTDCPPWLLKTPKVFFWDIPDPKDKGEAYKKHVADMIKDEVRGLVRELEPDTTF